MKNRVEIAFFGIVTVLLFVIITTISTSAAINPQINFQGKITNPDGTNIANGSYSIRFRLYSDPTLDAANACIANSCTWEETKSITITDGIFQTALGDTTPLPGSVDFNAANIYLGIKVGVDTEMTPRVRFTASPYAFNSEKVGGLSASQLVQLSPGAQQTGSINVSGSITTASTVAIQGASALSLGSTTNVGAILFQDGTANNRTVTLNVPALATASYSLTLPTTAPAVSQCLQSGPTTASQLVFGSCGAGGGTSTLQQSYDASGAANPQILLSSTNGGFKIQDAATPVGGNLLAVMNNGGTRTYFGVTTTGLTVQNANGNALAFDSSTNTLRVFENVATPTNFASISYAGTVAIFKASTGTTQVGSGAGNITGNVTGAADLFSFSKTNTPAGAYAVNDFTVQRTLTGGVNVLAGSVLRVQDASTGSASSPNVVLINQDNTGATGNLLLAQTGGTTTQFSVSTAGNGLFAGNLTVQGASSVTLGSTTNAGSIIFQDGTVNNRTVTLNIPALAATSYSLTLPTTAPAVSQCLQSGPTTASQLVFGSCGTGGGGTSTLQQSYDTSGATNPQILLSSTSGGFKLQDAATPIGGNLLAVMNSDGTRTYFGIASTGLTVQNSNGNALVFDSSTNTLRVFENVATPTNFASISYTGTVATFRASTGTTQVGSGAGNITGNVTGAADLFSFTKTNTPAGSYAVNDFTVQRTLTGGVNVLTGSVLRVQDSSTGSASSPNVVLINQDNTGATGNLLLAQTGGATTRFSVSTAGNGFFAGNLTVQGASSATLGSTTNVGAILFQDGTANNRTVTLNVPALATASYSLTLPTTAPAVSQCLQSGPTTASQLVFGSCGGGTLQESYTASAAPALITTSDAKDLQVSLADTATDANFFVNIATGSTGRFAVQNNSVDILNVRSGIISVVNGAAGVIIGTGFSTSDTNLTPLVLDSTVTLNESVNTCTSTVNNGAMYFNANAGSMAVRTCIGGGWEDLISTSGAFFAFFGIVPDSGTVPGDIQSLSTAAVSGPCKVSWASATSVNIQACTVYSGGRKVTVAATSLTVGVGLNLFQHICLTGTNSQPAITAPGSEVANLSSVSFPVATSPIVCLADIKTSASAISGIYDTRVFTTTTKEFGYASVALPLGVAVKPDATTPNRLALPGVTATGFIRGVVVASNGAAYTAGGPNVIIATAGPVSPKASAGTLSATVTVQNSTTVNGYVQTGATSANVYGNLGLPQNAFSTTCTSAITCRSSLLIDMRLR